MPINALNDVYSFVDSAGRVQQSEEPGIGATAATPSITKDAPRTPVAPDQQFLIANLQTVQSLNVPATATIAHIQNNSTQAIRWRDTSDPTTTLGRRIIVGGELTYNGVLANLKIIAEATGTGTVDIGYYK